MHNHEHRCHCEHKRIKFCVPCNAPYCVDCKQEWRNQTFYWSHPTYTNTTYTLLSGMASSAFDTTPAITWHADHADAS
jgi:hypothetical protein